MAGNAGEFEDGPMDPGSYSQLLFGDDDQISSVLETDGCFGFNSSFSHDDDDDDDNANNNINININTPKMLCFGDYAKQRNLKAAVENAKKTGQRSGPACKDSSLPISNMKRIGSGSIQNLGFCSGAPTGTRRNSKKPKSDNSTVVKKEKLGDRITALQQLVSPFGKTDTASVLHEALGYIGFLHDQVQVLCSAYLQRCSSASYSSEEEPDDGESKEINGRRKNDMRSRGLCLVPVEPTLHVSDSNGADLWSSAAMVVDTVSTS